VTRLILSKGTANKLVQPENILLAVTALDVLKNGTTFIDLHSENMLLKSVPDDVYKLTDINDTQPEKKLLNDDIELVPEKLNFSKSRCLTFAPLARFIVEMFDPEILISNQPVVYVLGKPDLLCLTFIFTEVKF